ncbi:MAG: hypothetical protein ABTQ34_05455 [Bdellovibrionales bacterium]
MFAEAPSKGGFFHFLERMGVLSISGIAIGMAVLGLWIAIWSTQEKVRLSHGVGQIVQVVSLSRELALSYPYLGNNGHEDLLAALHRVQRLPEAREVEGVFALDNPWDGMLFAVTIPDQMMRVETIVPPRTCRRIVDIFAENPSTLGVLRIEVKGWEQPWKTVYAADENLAFDDKFISDVCQSAARAQVSLRLKLR